MKLSIIISSDNPEIIWNSFRLANLAIEMGDEVKIFLFAGAVEYEQVSTSQFDLLEQAENFVKAQNSAIFACGTCLRIRDQAGTELCPVSSLQDMYGLVAESDKVLAF